MPFASTAWASEDEVYSKVMNALDKYGSRVPGSPEYYESIDALEQILKDNGINVQRQVYPTYVPKTTRYEFVINGTENVKVYPLAPNNVSLITTGPNPIEADIIYLPQKDLYESYGEVKNKIVLLDWGETYYPKTLFTEGAKAIVFVGNDKATQWEIAKLQNQYNISFPYFYITREEAEAHHLLDPYDKANPKKAKFIYNSAWEVVEAVNLWAEIKGSELKTFELSAPEAVILGARMDTFGSVPGLVRSDRHTANIALLAQVGVNLSKMDLNRSFFLIFYGSSFNTYDGLRNFYFPYYKRNSKVEPTLDDYLQGYKDELVDIEKEIEILYKDPVSKDENEFQYRVRMLLRDAVVKAYNNVNYELSDINLQIRTIHAKLAGKTLDGKETGEKLNPDQVYDLNQKLENLEKQKEAKDAFKVQVSNLRRDINEREIGKDRKAVLEKYFISEVGESLETRKKELESTIRMSNDWIKIADAMRPYAFLGAYFFDFAADDQPFILCTRSYQMPHYAAAMDISVYNKYFNDLKSLLPSLKMQKGPTPILEDSIRTGFTPDNLSSRSLLYLPNAVGLSLKLAGFSMRNVPGNYDYDEIPGKHVYSLVGLVPALDEFFEMIGTNEKFSSFSMIPDSNIEDKYFNYYYKNGKYYGTKYSFLGADG